jgi:hypothetical protein
MGDNPYDQASRCAARLDPPGFLGWVFDLPPDGFAFEAWPDTRNIPFPGDPDRTNDTVARVADTSTAGPPWAVAVEFQSRPDPDMFARLLVYLGCLSPALRPDPERGSRFQLGAAVVNLTGTGTASRRMTWDRIGLVTELRTGERNLEREQADALVGEIESGRRPRAILPWVALLAGAEAIDLIDRWKRAAAAEPDSRRRSDYAGLARVFAERAGRKDVREKQLEGWNVEESTVVNGWIAQGEARGEARGAAKATRASIVRIATKRFDAPSSEQLAALDAITDLDRLARLDDRLLDAVNWDDLLATP